MEEKLESLAEIVEKHSGISNEEVRKMLDTSDLSKLHLSINALKTQLQSILHFHQQHKDTITCKNIHRYLSETLNLPTYTIANIHLLD